MTRSVEIPEEAVKAAELAAQAAYQGGVVNGRNHQMRAALAAALPYLVPAEPDPVVVDAHAYVVGMEHAGCANPRHADLDCPVLAPAGDGGLRDALAEIGLTRSEIRDEVDELIRNAYAEGWREAKLRPDGDPPLLDIKWTGTRGVLVTEMWCECEIDPERRLLLGPHHEINCLRYVNGPARPPDAILALLRGESGGEAAHPAAPAVPQPADERPLRDALEKLAAKYERASSGYGGTASYRSYADELSGLLAHHPACPQVEDGEAHGPHQVASLDEGVWRDCPGFAQPAHPAAHAVSTDTAESTASTSAVPQPVDREALAICLHSFDGYAIEAGEGWAECTRKSAFLHQADAVLALFGDSEETPGMKLSRLSMETNARNNGPAVLAGEQEQVEP